MNKPLSILSASLLAMSVSGGAGADVYAIPTSLVEWDLTGAAGTEASLAASSAAAGITGLDLTRGAGLQGNGGTNSLNTKGWNGEAGDYLSFGFNVAAGHDVDLFSLVIGTKSSNTGPGLLGLYYSGDGFASNLFTFDEGSTYSGGTTSYLNSIVDLSALQNLTGNVEFRIKQIGNISASGGVTGTTGTFRIAEHYDGTTYTNLLITAPVPEADTYAFLALGMGLVGLLARRRKA